MAVVATLVTLAWVVFVAVDLLGLTRPRLEETAWLLLFNDRPVEWLQWLLQGGAILSAGFIAGRLTSEEDRGLRAFLLVLAGGLVFMLFEDAGDARHEISGYVRQGFGDDLLGLPYRVVSDVPYLMVVAALPIYAVLRYGRDAWRSPSSRPYLVTGFALYALAGGASSLRHLGGLYISIGAAVDRVLFAGRFPVPSAMTQDRAHFFVIDAVFEESIETMAAASLLAAILAIGLDVRERQLTPVR